MLCSSCFYSYFFNFIVSLANANVTDAAVISTLYLKVPILCVTSIDSCSIINVPSYILNVHITFPFIVMKTPKFGNICSKQNSNEVLMNHNVCMLRSSLAFASH